MMPTNSDKLISGHSMVIVGWTGTHWIVKNHWGDKWGDKGFCYMPPEYIELLAHDFWIIYKLMV